MNAFSECLDKSYLSTNKCVYKYHYYAVSKNEIFGWLDCFYGVFDDAKIYADYFP